MCLEQLSDCVCFLKAQLAGIYDVIQGLLYNPANYVSAGTTIDDATLITKPGVVNVEVNTTDTGVILPNLYGVFIISISNLSNKELLVYPNSVVSVINTSSGPLPAGDPLPIFGTYGSAVIVRTGPATWMALAPY